MTPLGPSVTGLCHVDAALVGRALAGLGGGGGQREDGHDDTGRDAALPSGLLFRVCLLHDAGLL